MSKVARPYQTVGARHLVAMPGGLPHSLLADEPGTGKTLQTIMAAKETNCKHGVIICPAIIKEQWSRELVSEGLAAPDEIQVVYGQDAVLDSRPWKIVNYDLVRETQMRKQFLARSWHALVLDEAHRLKTHNSQQTHAVLHKSYGIANRAYWKWALSGSIVPNRPVELYPLLRSLAPYVLGKIDTFEKFKEYYCGGAFMEGKGASNIPELTERMQPFMLLRSLVDVWKDCPEVVVNEVWLDVHYQSHPEFVADGMYEATERRVVAEAKIPHTVAYLKDRLGSGSQKIAVSSYHRHVIEQFAIELKDFNPVIIYGGISAKKREENIAKFRDDATCRLFLMQIASAGEGLDGLQHVTSEYVSAEPEWSPGREDQGLRRILRLGQLKPVIHTKLLASNSYEEVIFGSNTRKRTVISVIQKPNGGSFIMPTIEENLNRIATAAEAFVPIAVLLTKILEQAGGVGALTALATPAAPPAVTLPLPTASVMPTPVAPPITAPPLVLAPPALSLAPAPIAAAIAPTVALAPTPATAPIAPAIAISSPERAAFEKTVLSKLQPLGQPGAEKMKALCLEAGVERLGQVPETHFAWYLSQVG